MPAIVYNTRFDPAYRNAEAQVAAPADTVNTVIEEKTKPVFISKSNIDKYFFMAVIVIGLGVVIYKSMKK